MRHGRLTGIIVGLSILGLWPAAADACKCFTGPEACSGIAEADAIFEATVASIETRSRSLPDSTVTHQERVVRLRDVRGWRGRVADVVVTGIGGGDCGYDFQVGVRYVIVGDRNESDGLVRTGVCSMTSPLAQAGAMRDYVESLSAPSTGGRLWGTVATQKPWAPGDGTPREPKPVANVRVTITGPAEASVTTGPDGRFSFDTLPPGDYRLSAELGDHKIDFKGPVATTLEGPYACAVLDILVPSAASLNGIVMYDDGRPAAGVPVQLVAAEPRAADAFLGVGGPTDEDGAYTLSSVPPGRYLVGVGAVGGPSRSEPFALVYGRVDPGDVVITVREEDEAIFVAPMVTRRLAPIRVQGAVRWPDETPAHGLVVTAAAVGEGGPVRGLVRSETLVDGRFTLDVFAETRYRVSFARRGRVVHSVEIVAGDAPLLVTLPDREELR